MEGKPISQKKLLSIAGLGWMFDAMDVGMLSFIIAALKVDWDLTLNKWAGLVVSTQSVWRLVHLFLVYGQIELDEKISLLLPCLYFH